MIKRLLNLLKSTNKGEKKYAFFSIDVERFTDTECISKSNQPIEQTMLDGLDRYMEILDKHNIKATMFVIGDLAEDIYAQLKKHLDNGHRIALHGKEHIAPVLMTNKLFKSQTAAAKKKLEKLFSVPVLGYRAPCFGIDSTKLEILQKLGFTYDSSRMDFSAAKYTKPLDMSEYENPMGEIYIKDGFAEFGLSMQKVFGKNYPISGGGYVRIPNWSFAKSLLKHYIKNSDYYVFYSHPFEFSHENVPFVKNLKFYDRIYLKLGLRSYRNRMEYIIRKLKKAGFTFSTFEDILQNSEKEPETKNNETAVK